MGNSLGSFIDKLNHIEIKFDYGAHSPLAGKKIYVYAFFLPVIIVLISYMIFGVYPSGDKSVLVFDLRDQYVNYYEYFRDVFWGNRSPWISWSRNLSGETMGLFAYYLASPFNLIVFLFPRSMIMESVLIMLLLKVGTASVTFCYYLRHSQQTNDSTTLIFSMLYSMMSYTIIQLANPMFLEGVIYLPLVCLGIEKLVDKGTCLQFIIPLTLMFTSNFYIGWMMAIFSCLYFIAYYVFFSDSRRGLKMYAIFPKGIKFAFSGILSAVCSAWLLIPLYCSLSLGKLSYSEPDYSIITNFDFSDFFVNLLPNTYDTLQYGGSPVVYCGVLTLILVPLYLFNNGIDFRKRVGYGVLAAFLIVSMYSFGIDVIWHGFQPPNGIPYRYSFALCFLLLVMAAQSFDRIDKISYTKVGCVFFLLLGYVFYIDKQDIIVETVIGDIKKTDLYWGIWFAAAMIVIYVLLVYFHKKNYRTKPVPLFILLCIIVELVSASVYTMKKMDKDVSYRVHSRYEDFNDTGRDIVNNIYSMDDGVYRIEKDFYLTTCDAMTWGNFGVAHSSSTLNSGIIKFLKRMGFSNREHLIRYLGATYVTDSILGIKYVMEEEDIEEPDNSDNGRKGANKFQDYVDKLINVMHGKYYKRDEAQHYYDKLAVTGSEDDKIINVYENPYALPIGFMADSSIADLKLADWYNPFENQNMLLSSLLSDEAQDFFIRIDIDDIKMDNVTRDIFDAHDWYRSTEEGVAGMVDFILTAPNNEMIYMFFPSDYKRDIRLLIDDELFGKYYDDEFTFIATLGRFEPGEEIKVTAEIISGYREVMFKDKYFYYLDEQKFAEAVDKLKQHPLEIESFKENHLKGNVTAEKDGILFTSITYEPGWSIYIDGVKTEPVKLMGALIGIPMTEGYHTVEMKFFPKGLLPGIIISFIGIAAVVLIGLYEHKKYSVKKDAE